MHPNQGKGNTTGIEQFDEFKIVCIIETCSDFIRSGCCWMVVQFTDLKLRFPHDKGSRGQRTPLSAHKGSCLDGGGIAQNNRRLVEVRSGFLSNHFALPHHQLRIDKKITAGRGNIQPMNGQEVGTLPEVLEGTTHIEGFEQNGLSVVMRAAGKAIPDQVPRCVGRSQRYAVEKSGKAIIISHAKLQEIRLFQGCRFRFKRNADVGRTVLPRHGLAHIHANQGLVGLCRIIPHPSTTALPTIEGKAERFFPTLAQSTATILITGDQDPSRRLRVHQARACQLHSFQLASWIRSIQRVIQAPFGHLHRKFKTPLHETSRMPQGRSIDLRIEPGLSQLLKHHG